MIEPGKKRLRAGFTLVEILLVVSMVAMISISLYTAFSNGFKLWARGQHFVMEEDIAIFFDKIGEDLRNSFQYSLIAFKGRERSISFPTVVYAAMNSKETKSGHYIHQIGRVEYHFDPIKNQLFRRQADYGQALKDEFPPERTLLNNVMDVEFNYFYAGADADARMEKTTVMDELPNMVKVKIRYNDDRGRAREFYKIIAIPTDKTGGEIDAVQAI